MGNNIIKYHGGKSRLADWIISFMPPHKCYVEAYGGGFSVGLKKLPVNSEVYNDQDGEVVNFFRMVRERGEELAFLVNMTVFARDEMELAYELSTDPLERARRFLVRAEMAITTTSLNDKSGFRSCINSKDYSSQFLTFFKKPEVILKTRDRLARVAIENTDAFKLFPRFDRPGTLWYLDPPYLNETRGEKSIRCGYNYNMTNEQHLELMQVVNQLKGKVIISGYDSPLYNEHLAGWHRVQRKSYDGAKNMRCEVLWMNYRLAGQQEKLF